MSELKKFIISAPFGNYINWENATSTLGTYTLERRAGFWKRLWRVLSTVRPHPKMRAWTNKLGLPNPGIESLYVIAARCMSYDRMILLRDKILSLSAKDNSSWIELVKWSVKVDKLKNIEWLSAIELNRSCPNCPGERDKTDYKNTYREISQIWKKIITVKIPPIGYEEMVDEVAEAGFYGLHCCNTLSTPCGGLSGKPLQQLSLAAVKYVKKHAPSLKIIGGGGITHFDDVQRFLNAGADHVSVASGLFNPFNWFRLRRIAESLEHLRLGYANRLIWR